MPTTTSFLSISKTFTSASVAEPLSLVSIPFYSANFYVADNGCYYGNGTNQGLYIPAGGYFDHRFGDLKDIFFITDGVGDTKITVVATVPVEYVKTVLEIGGKIGL